MSSSIEVEDGRDIKVAYNQAAEAHTVTVLNVASSSKGLDELIFYIIPAAWYRKAWRLLLRPLQVETIPADWREQIGELPPVKAWWNGEHDGGNGGENHRDDDGKNDKDQTQKKGVVLNELRSAWKQDKTTNGKTVNKTHEKDFYFLGEHAWTVVKGKFGNASEEGVPCHVVSFPSKDSRLAVLLPGGAGHRIPIPPSGRFAYEESLSKEDEEMEDAAVNTVEEEDENMEMSSNAQEGPILMLPPSTTPQSPGRDLPGSRATATPTLRQYGSGLANLGNTCFMSSTIQCLGHTHQVLKYFLSGSYMDDLNRDNPLGTGGELAIEFAKLLRDIWVQNDNATTSQYGYVSNNVVYPRSFKGTVGRHAEQFSGYDQHDTQEFATYLLDALHEDTNRVTKKPYIEKPEQGEDESDEQAADKAWELHLRRENSRVLESFMGQVKSRVQCCEESCGRVSTTFDPFMYLSVPIPGSSDRRLAVTFVPLDPDQRPQKLTLIIQKTATIADMISKCRERMISIGTEEADLEIEDMIAIDVWNKEVFKWYKDEDEVETIRDSDETFIYQLRPLKEVRRLSTTTPSNTENEDALESSELASSGRKYQLDVATLRRLNQGDAWSNELKEYLRNHMGFVSLFNVSKGTTEGRVKFLREFQDFLTKCQDVLEKHKENQAEGIEEKKPRRQSILTAPSNDSIPGIVELCHESKQFENVSSEMDVAILQFCAGKIRDEILNLIRLKKKKELPDGVIVQTKCRRFGSFASSRDNGFVGPLILRLPSNMTVYELREELAYRMRRSIRTGNEPASASGEASSEMDVQRETGLLSPPSTRPRPHTNGFDNSFGPPELLVLRQVPLSYEAQSKNQYRTSSHPASQLGSLEKPGYDNENRRPLAKPNDDEEKEEVAPLVGAQGTILLEWPSDLVDEFFDTYEYGTIENAKDDEDVVNAHKPKTTTTVLDCIDKYCQMEQLEETEMWYCNRCKKHVRAWKQFHIYRAPPILIIHLKRFQYSATTHRRDKLGEFIDFPLEGLDLTDHVMHWQEGEKPIYDCYGVSNHYGGLGGGHYTAHALHDNGVWCYYDDTRITSEVDPKEAVSNAAYVLYYRRRDVPKDTNFSICTTTPGERREPAIILENSDKMNGHPVLTGSNAAIIREDDQMEVEVENLDAASRSTSPMGSTGWPDEDHDQFTTSVGGGVYSDDALPDDQDQLPRQ